MFKKLSAGLCASVFILAFSGPVFGQTLTGVVTRLQVALKLADGSTKMLEVKDDVNLDHVDEGDEVKVQVVNNEIVAIEVTKENDEENPRKKPSK